MSVSRGRYDAQIYTNEAERLGEELSQEVSKRAALETEHELSGQHQTQAVEHTQHPSQSESHEQGHGHGMER